MKCKTPQKTNPYTSVILMRKNTLILTKRMLHFITKAIIQSLITIYFLKIYTNFKSWHIAPWLVQYAHQKGQFAQGRDLTFTTIFDVVHCLDSDVKHFSFDIC